MFIAPDGGQNCQKSYLKGSGTFKKVDLLILHDCVLGQCRLRYLISKSLFFCLLKQKNIVLDEIHESCPGMNSYRKDPKFSDKSSLDRPSLGISLIRVYTIAIPYEHFRRTAIIVGQGPPRAV